MVVGFCASRFNSDAPLLAAVAAAAAGGVGLCNELEALVAGCRGLFVVAITERGFAGEACRRKVMTVGTGGMGTVTYASLKLESLGGKNSICGCFNTKVRGELRLGRISLLPPPPPSQYGGDVGDMKEQAPRL